MGREHGGCDLEQAACIGLYIMTKSIQADEVFFFQSPLMRFSPYLFQEEIDIKQILKENKSESDMEALKNLQDVHLKVDMPAVETHPF